MIVLQNSQVIYKIIFILLSWKKKARDMFLQIFLDFSLPTEVEVWDAIKGRKEKGEHRPWYTARNWSLQLPLSVMVQRNCLEKV
jgi:hypothetical protein